MSISSIHGEALVDGEGRVWLPCDRAHLPSDTTAWRRLCEHRDVRHAGRQPFRWQVPARGTLHVLNGMGITLGDSVIGMNALAWLKLRHPSLRIHLYRSPHAPAFVERLYQLARGIVDAVTLLPIRLADLPEDVVDLSDVAHWPAFATRPMVDFFFEALGLDPQSAPPWAKANRWLSRLPVPPLGALWSSSRYVLLCDQASTPLRSLPRELAPAAVDRIWRRYGLPVLGFHPIAHPQYHDVSARSRTLDEYLAWVQGARVVVGTDSSGIHIAAGFDVPTLAFFTSIDPGLRVRDYSKCHVVDLRTDLTRGLHQSSDPRVLAEVARAWRATLARAEWPWPAPRGSACDAAQSIMAPELQQCSRRRKYCAPASVHAHRRQPQRSERT